MSGRLFPFPIQNSARRTLRSLWLVAAGPGAHVQPTYRIYVRKIPPDAEAVLRLWMLTAMQSYSQHCLSHLVMAPGMAAPIAIISKVILQYRRKNRQPKGFCGLRVHKETHLLLSQSIQMSLERIHWRCIYHCLWQAVPTVDNTCREEIQSGVSVTEWFDQLLVMASCTAVSCDLKNCWQWSISKLDRLFRCFGALLI